MFFAGLNADTRLVEKWLDDYINYDDKEYKYAIIQAKSGNGKTYFTEYLSKQLNASIFSISPFDIQSNDDMNNTIKSLNLSNIFTDTDKKIIVIDDFDLFHWRYRQNLLSLPDTSIYPVIYTLSNYSYIKYFDNYSLKVTKNKRIIQIQPQFEEIYQLLCKISDRNRLDLVKIAKYSPSVRSAILTSKYGSVNWLIEEQAKPWELVTKFHSRNYDKPLSYKNKHFFLHQIQSAKNISTLSSVVDRLLDFQYRIMCKYETYDGVNNGIHQFHINSMREHIEDITMRYNPFKSNNKKKYQKKEKPKKIEKKKKQVSNSVDNYF